MEPQTVEWLQEHEGFTLPALKPISSCFSIPRLDDKPQDPIVQTLLVPAQSRTPLHDSLVLPLSPVPSGVKVLPSDISTQDSKSPLASAPLWKEASLFHTQDIVSAVFMIQVVVTVIKWTTGPFHVLGSEPPIETSKFPICDRTTS